jgi:hypothetical protein
VFFGWQMLGLVAPFGLVYLLGSYVVAIGVVNVLMEQRRKNLKTMQSDLKEEMLYLIGLCDPEDADGPSSLREIIVAQIRREALYRRMVRDEAAGREPEVPFPLPSTGCPRGADEAPEGGSAISPADRTDETRR